MRDHKKQAIQLLAELMRLIEDAGPVDEATRQLFQRALKIAVDTLEIAERAKP